MSLLVFCKTSFLPDSVRNPINYWTRKYSKNAAEATHIKGITCLAFPAQSMMMQYVMNPRPIPSVIEYANGINKIVINAGMDVS